MPIGKLPKLFMMEDNVIGCKQDMKGATVSFGSDNGLKNVKIYEVRLPTIFFPFVVFVLFG